MLRNKLDDSIDETDDTLAISETVLPIEMILHTFNLADTPNDVLNNAQSCRFFNRLVRATSPFIKKDVKDFPNYTYPSESTTSQLKTGDGDTLTFLPDNFKHCFVLNADKVFTLFFVGSGYLVGIIKIQPPEAQQTNYTANIYQWRPLDWVTSPIKINSQAIAYPCRDGSICVCEWSDDMKVTYRYLSKDKCVDTKSQYKNSDGIAGLGCLTLRKSDGMLIHLSYHPEFNYLLDFYDVNNCYAHVNTSPLSQQLPPFLNIEELTLSHDDNLILHDTNTIYVTNKSGEELLRKIDTKTTFTQLHSLPNNKVALLTLSGIDIWCLTTQACIQHIDRPDNNNTGQYQLKVLATGELLVLDTSAKVRKLAIFNASLGELVQDLSPKEMNIANAIIMPNGEIISILDNKNWTGNICLQTHRFKAKPELQEEKTVAPTRLSY